MTKTSALAILGACAAGVAGRSISQLLIGWIPKIGNVINATTAFGITEGIGWAANAMLAEELPQKCPAVA